MILFSSDEPLEHLIPELACEGANRKKLTMRQLMTHMSGLGRDWPPGDASDAWPKSLDGSGPPWYNGLPFPTREKLIEGIISNELVTPPYSFPTYSNTGFALLGVANVAANKAKEGEKAPSTHSELLHRDIFAPLGLNSSAFAVSEETKGRVAVASFLPEETVRDIKLASYISLDT